MTTYKAIYRILPPLIYIANRGPKQRDTTFAPFFIIIILIILIIIIILIMLIIPSSLK